MRAAVIEAPGQARVVELTEPPCGPGQARVAVAWCGVCGTDVHILHGGFRADYPLTPGHEFSGTVVEVGAGVTDLAVGDRVTIDPNIVCGACAYCRRGLVHLCERLTAVGVNQPGGFAERCVVPVAQAYRLPESVSFEQAACCEPLACCVHGVDRAAIAPGERVLVVGAGPIGLLMAQLARVAGAALVAVADPVAAKRDLALSLGADLAIDPAIDDVARVARAAMGIGPDVVFECVGRADTVLTALSSARRGGRVVLFGVCPKEAEVALRPYEVFLNELTVMGSYINPFTHQRALELLAGGRVRVEPLISHRFGLEQFGEALAVAGSGQALKVLVGPGG
ncbi:MAG: zinc-dependent alcohol dehydrogenase family protein [Armatimonadetes bacterium]|nr:zinc-dependent alcohol dehydrogenase family protein [Armatimonadota bacterium]